MNLMYGSPWAGTETALYAAAEALAKIEANNTQTGSEDAAGYEVADGIAKIPVKGPMVNIDLPQSVCAVFGITSYPSLQRMMADAAADDDVERVVLDINSGGGQVDGLADTVETLKELKAVKPVSAYAGGMMASAAYWLGSAADGLSASPSATVGSIGVIGVHVSQRESMEKEGYKPTVLRSGEHKHLAHPFEDLSEQARADMQRGLDFHHQQFLNAVSENRNIPLAALQAGIGDGRVFYGQEAADVGLVDRIETFRSFMAGRRNGAPIFGKGGTPAAADAHAPQIELQTASDPAACTSNHGEDTMNLDEAMAKVEALQGELSVRDTALAEAEARATKAEADLAQAVATKDALAASLATANEANAQFSAVLEANIQAKAAALGTRVLMPDTLADRQKLNAQLEQEFQAAFPSGRVSASPAAQAAQSDAQGAPAWLKRVTV